ncbi:NUDIX hydrolase [Nitrincola tapanii]|uniref:Phosphatase NudJ n=1 Tax=Nitrincola tapanii TaxID=1708751 RepID=A0A5A9W6F6_9GAMM|nr:NUDIX hydrolase [Nitrincola tapanii]KAA0876380.1 NUDIX hydrolase [Nitrincola tapanii]
MRFLPHVTVAALIEQEGRFLLVEEGDPKAPVFNQPAGHIEARETPAAACIREALEETGWSVEPLYLLGIYLLDLGPEKTYYRFGFVAKAIEKISDDLDQGILGRHWLTLEEIRTLHQQGRLRSDLVMQLIEDYLAGRQFPLDLIRT